MRTPKKKIKLRLLRHIYIARRLTNYLIVGCLLVSNSLDLDAYHIYLYAMILILLVSLHIIFRMHTRSKEIKLKSSFEKTEYRSALLGNVQYGARIPLVFFNPLLTFILVLISYVNDCHRRSIFVKKGFLTSTIRSFFIYFDMWIQFSSRNRYIQICFGIHTPSCLRGQRYIYQSLIQ